MITFILTEPASSWTSSVDGPGSGRSETAEETLGARWAAGVRCVCLRETETRDQSVCAWIPIAHPACLDLVPKSQKDGNNIWS